MPIGAIILQPPSNSINAAYRPVVVRVAATNTDASARPPVVYCDIYFNDVFYKTLSKSQYSKLNPGNSEWQFDIQDAAQEYLKKFLANNGEVAIKEAPLVVTKTSCKLRSSGFDGNGFIQHEGTAPVQGTSDMDPVSGTGTATHTFYIVNATLQHADNQDLCTHLNYFKTRTWASTTWPLSHRPDHYKVCLSDSDSFAIVHGGVKNLSCLRLNYRYKGQVSFHQVTTCNTSACAIVSNLAYGIVDNGNGTQTITFSFDPLPIDVSTLVIQSKLSGTTDPWTDNSGSPVSPRFITRPYGHYDFRFLSQGSCAAQTSPETDNIGISGVGGCTAVGIVGTPVLPDAEVGTIYNYSINLTGTTPFALSSIVKPAWMTITITGSTVDITGVPDVGDVAGGVVVSFDVTNCAADIISFADTIDVDPALECILVGVAGGPAMFPDATVGVPYNYDINLTGTAPFHLDSVTKPSWMTITLVGSQIQLRGTPVPGDAGVGIDVSIVVSNCGDDTPIVISDTINVTGEDGFGLSVKVSAVGIGLCGAVPETLYTITGALATGLIVYDDSFLTVPHTGDSFITTAAPGLFYSLDSVTGEIGGVIPSPC
jgi:hypothetical protein